MATETVVKLRVWTQARSETKTKRPGNGDRMRGAITAKDTLVGRALGHGSGRFEPLASDVSTVWYALASSQHHILGWWLLRDVSSRFAPLLRSYRRDLTKPNTEYKSLAVP